MKKLIPVMLTILVMTSPTVICQEKGPITITFKKSALEGNDVMLSDVADEISYIKLETHPNALIGSASSYYVVQMSDNFVIWNSRGSGNILMFGPDGRFKGFVGSEGKGPGEYSANYKVIFDKYLDNILVFVNQ